MPEQQGTDWASLLAQGLAWYMGRGTSGDTPNFYPIPKTPEDKRWDDARWDLYQQGGSEGQQAVRAAAMQALGGMPRTANPTFASPMMRGQPFAGGIMLPKIDLSGFDVNARPPSGTPATPTGVGAGGRGTVEGRRAERSGDGGDPLNPPSGGGPFGPDPHGLDDMPTGPAQTPGETWDAISKWWADWRSAHPDWKTTGAKLALTTAASMFGGPLAATFFRTILSKVGNGNQPLPNPTDSFADVARGAPGTRDQNGADPLPVGRSFADVARGAPGTRDREGNPPPSSGGYRVDPRTGKVAREDDPFNYGGFAGGANVAANDEFWRGLQSGPGGGGLYGAAR